ncbi:hypothetical protein EJ04DRAFT_57558 [Polyplosphaeria fusca]|uniref:Uncharacterized protein n=1 Tax=Polyplosphaeria fusca TaxID=682080 RepID=A0A9P4QNX4_9PLEO|nr:hypothetical protein EJ04DRAFT_57558 [Polyplosphaeria fusca]
MAEISVCSLGLASVILHPLSRSCLDFSPPPSQRLPLSRPLSSPPLSPSPLPASAALSTFTCARSVDCCRSLCLCLDPPPPPVREKTVSR